MNPKFFAAFILTAAVLTPVTGAFADDLDKDHPLILVKDSAITVLIKSKLAANKMDSLKNIKVDTDDHGVVWLTGTASTQKLVDQAESIARNTDGVRAVKNQIAVKAD